MSETGDRAARLVAELDQAKAMKVEAGGLDAAILGGFFKELRSSGLSEEHAFTLTHEWLILTLSAQDKDD